MKVCIGKSGIDDLNLCLAINLVWEIRVSHVYPDSSKLLTLN